MADQSYAALKTIFHEPSRLALMTALGNAPKGMSFSELKAKCELTDGNLSRHLSVLQDANAIRIRKSFKGVKPHTHVTLSANGRKHFLNYLEALEEVLREAASSMNAVSARAEPKSGGTPALGAS